MLDRNYLRTHPEIVKRGAHRKQIDAPIDEWLQADKEHRKILSELEALRADLNKASKAIGQLFAEGKKEEAEAARLRTKECKEAIANQEEIFKKIEEELEYFELRIPNLPQEGVPDGKDENDNPIIRSWEEKRSFHFEPKPHWVIAEELKLLDLERASKISGSGFAVYTGWGARLQRALINFMIDWQTQKRGYYEVYPPVIVLRECLFGTGNLPKFEEDLYRINERNYLIPTAEVPLTNLFRDEILNIDQLPTKMAAFTSCFRSEAGAAGKDTRGLLRMHQFEKVELMKYTLPENSNHELELLAQDAESVLQALAIPYRVSMMCTAEMSFSNAKQYDLELWAPGVDKYLEISSCSNFESFQARRANIRFRREQGAKPEFVHTLNGSGLATPRLFAAILENGQQDDGSVTIPAPLVPYLGTQTLSKIS